MQLIKKHHESEVSVENCPRKVQAQGKIPEFILKTDQKAKQELDLLGGVFLFMYSYFIPFSVVEHPSFKALLKKFCPDMLDSKQ